MKNQHMRNQIKTVKKEEITADDLKALKHDVSGLKFELLSYIKHLPKVFKQFESDQEKISDKLKKAQSTLLRNSIKLNEHYAAMKTMCEEHAQVELLYFDIFIHAHSESNCS